MKKFLIMVATVALVACAPVTDSYDGKIPSVVEDAVVERVNWIGEIVGGIIVEEIEKDGMVKEVLDLDYEMMF